jgi:hypothetical protein
VKKLHTWRRKETLDWHGVECGLCRVEQALFGTSVRVERTWCWTQFILGCYRGRCSTVPLMTGKPLSHPQRLNHISLPQSVIQACLPEVSHDLVF